MNKTRATTTVHKCLSRLVVNRYLSVVTSLSRDMTLEHRIVITVIGGCCKRLLLYYLLLIFYWNTRRRLVARSRLAQTSLRGNRNDGRPCRSVRPASPTTVDSSPAHRPPPRFRIRRRYHGSFVLVTVLIRPVAAHVGINTRLQCHSVLRLSCGFSIMKHKEKKRIL